MTFVEYLARYRVVQAKRLLNNPAMSIADVAAAVDFNDPSYFTRVFRRIAGVYRGCPPALAPASAGLAGISATAG